MAKTRLHEIAKELGLKSNEVVNEKSFADLPKECYGAI